MFMNMQNRFRVNVFPLLLIEFPAKVFTGMLDRKVEILL
ncbi:hypothetical protein KIS1582_3584 [Cytobacillus firmus]|uniref:Uncharacterized protein n=1 Tax=Cytobacillus firmus TaxID=1399 RepID=A0A800N9J6_CYTFI|nr:hypothetical protein KIS1582_3584 [Cytobacillus firmus]